MEVFLALIIIAVPVIIIIILITINNKLDNNRAAVEELRDGLDELRRLILKQAGDAPARPVVTIEAPAIEKAPVIIPQPPKEQPVIVHPPLREEVIHPKLEDEKLAPKKVVYSIDTTSVTTPVAPTQKPYVPEPHEGWFDKWLRDNPDLEKFIGENLINKIGIAVLVL